MICPYCNAEMRPGYIQCRDGVRWSEKKFPVTALTTLAKGSRSLANGAAENDRAVFAHLCPACKKVIIDYAGAKAEE